MGPGRGAARMVGLAGIRWRLRNGHWFLVLRHFVLRKAVRSLARGQLKRDGAVPAEIPSGSAISLTENPSTTPRCKMSRCSSGRLSNATRSSVTLEMFLATAKSIGCWSMAIAAQNVSFALKIM